MSPVMPGTLVIQSSSSLPFSVTSSYRYPIGPFGSSLICSYLIYSQFYQIQYHAAHHVFCHWKSCSSLFYRTPGGGRLYDMFLVSIRFCGAILSFEKKPQWNRTNYESSIGCCIYFYFLSFKQDCSRSGMKQINQLCFTYVSYYFSDANLSRDAGDL